MDEKYHARHLCPELVEKRIALENEAPLLPEIELAIKDATTPQSAKMFERQLLKMRKHISTLEQEISALEKVYQQRLATARKRNRRRDR